MTDLQLGLLVIGAIAIAAVVVYNRLQERATRRAAERAFRGEQPDVLLDGEGARREPSLRSDTDSETPAGAMPDARADYIIELSLHGRSSASAVSDLMASLEHRFGRRAMLAASDGTGWRRLRPGDAGPCVALSAALQLVSRAGVASEAEVLEFRSAVETAAARLKASIRAPEMREAVESAQALDRLCVEMDIQVALHILGSFSDEDLAPLGAERFHVARRDDGVTFTLDVPRTPEVARAYESMARAARALATAKDGRLVDDNGRALDDAALLAIGRQLEPAARALAEHGMEPGGELALRVFS
jgi:hypothetical protein